MIELLACRLGQNDEVLNIEPAQKAMRKHG